MPPLVEDSEASSEEAIPFRSSRKVQPEEEKEEEEEDVYVVESILEHKFQKDGSIIFRVKWQGYEDEADQTWETEDNLETAAEVVKEYYEELGGRPEPPARSSAAKKRGRKPGTKVGTKRSFGDVEDEAPAKGSGRGRKKRGASNGTPDIIDVPRKKKVSYPPASSDWDPYLISCETIEEAASGPRGLTKVALLQWDDGTKSRHALRLAHDHAPKTLLRFYETHLVFKQYDSTPQETGDDIDDVLPKEATSDSEEE